MTDAADEIQCAEHGVTRQTFLCRHLITRPSQRWHGAAPSEEERWPDAWCDACHRLFLREGEWNERNEGETEIDLICNRCYEKKQDESVHSLTGPALEEWQNFVRNSHEATVSRQEHAFSQYAINSYDRYHWEPE